MQSDPRPDINECFWFVRYPRDISQQIVHTSVFPSPGSRRDRTHVPEQRFCSVSVFSRTLTSHSKTNLRAEQCAGGAGDFTWHKTLITAKQNRTKPPGHSKVSVPAADGGKSEDPPDLRDPRSSSGCSGEAAGASDTWGDTWRDSARQHQGEEDSKLEETLAERRSSLILSSHWAVN
ncbi:unnamed protein product [Pleuronectes platessa]|uniref:Uncharacterized protein n=1 Tax=Pleuronectes platessa TaxID=8262 RepID=A0A9N7TPF2_PLEPL|nr:unnamed protein product [Pleuronectes platessa]